MLVVSDSTPLIHLAKIDRLYLLKNFFNKILIPKSVYEECVIDGESEDSKKIKNSEWIKIKSVENRELKNALMLELDKGESESITLAIEENADLILIDDYDGREIARELKLEITGTIGILLKAKSQNKIQNIETELEKLKANGFWLSQKIYQKVLKKADELSEEN